MGGGCSIRTPLSQGLGRSSVVSQGLHREQCDWPGARSGVEQSGLAALG